MPPGWWFLFFGGVTALQCYYDSQLIPAEEEVEYGMNTTWTNDTTRRCVVFRGHNGTHKTAVRGTWETHRLPYECLSYGQHCFSYRRLKNMTLYGCCCNESRCNENDDAVYMFYPKGFNPSFGITILQITRGLLCFIGSMTVPIWVTALVTFVYVKIKKCVKKKRVLTQYEEEQRLINYDVDGSWSDDEEVESFHPPPPPAEPRQSVSNKAIRIRKPHTTTTTNNTSTTTVNHGSSSSSQNVASAPLDPTPADSIAKLIKHTLEASTPPSATTPEYTRSTQKTERKSTKTAPQGPRPKSLTKTAAQVAPPKSIVLANGRVQKVSMMEDDEWDD